MLGPKYQRKISRPTFPFWGLIAAPDPSTDNAFESRCAVFHELHLVSCSRSNFPVSTQGQTDRRTPAYSCLIDISMKTSIFDHRMLPILNYRKRILFSQQNRKACKPVDYLFFYPTIDVVSPALISFIHLPTFHHLPSHRYCSTLHRINIDASRLV